MSSPFSSPRSIRRVAGPRGLPLLALATLGLLAAPAHAQRAALTQNVDDPGRTPFALAASNATLNPYFASFTVPANQRYVIEKYSAGCDVFASTALSEVSIQVFTGGNAVTFSAEAHLVQFNGNIGGAQVNYHRATGAGPLYADPGSTVTLFAATRAGTGYTYMRNCSFAISGHAIANP